MFFGAIWRLSLQTHWERDPNHSAKVVAAKWREIWNEVIDMPCCQDDASIINIQISNQLVINKQLAVTWNQIWLTGVQTVSIDYYAIPATYSTDPADAGDEIAQRELALCLATQGWLHEVMNYMESWMLGNFDEVAQLGGTTIVAAGAVSGLVMWPVIVGWVIAGILAEEAFKQLRNTEYREYLICRMLTNLQGKNPDLRSDFDAALTADPIGRPQPEDPVKDAARDLIEAYLRSQLNNLDNYLMFAGQLGTAMDIARGGAVACPCLEDWEHVFDFEIDEQGWQTMAGDSRDHGAYSAGVGWVSEFELQGGVTPPQAERLYIEIEGFSTRTLTSVVAEWEVDAGSFGGRSAPVIIKLASAQVGLQTHVDWPQPGVFTTTWIGSEVADEIETICVDGLPAEVDRQYILKKVTVTGEGLDPFPP